jgi:hypothetical protein
MSVKPRTCSPWEPGLDSRRHPRAFHLELENSGSVKLMHLNGPEKPEPQEPS